MRWLHISSVLQAAVAQHNGDLPAADVEAWPPFIGIACSQVLDSDDDLDAETLVMGVEAGAIFSTCGAI